MRFCIVSPPTVTEFSKEIAKTEAIKTLSEHAPIGVLTLAAVLEEQGFDLLLVDSNVLYYEWIEQNTDNQQFLDFVVGRLLKESFDAIGFGTICSTYPLTIRLAEELKKRRSELPVIFGGPQASAVDIHTMSNFRCVDYILRYEAEESLPALLNAIINGSGIESVTGLTYRDNDEIKRTNSPPVIDDLDAVPTPAFDLYPYIKEASYIPLELGRGCPYACTFCSTNDFFRRRFRLKSPKRVVAEMRDLNVKFGINHFDLIHDMFTVNRKKVIEFCETLIATDEKFFWNCSARTDRIDSELLNIMYEAGCRAIFYGIETGSQKLQTSIKKNLILTDAMEIVKATSENNINCAVSIITGFPEETEEDFRDTVEFFANALRYENAQPQLHILAPLADTPLHRQHRDELTFDDIVSDMSHQGWDQQSEDRELILKHPDVFPNFYALPTVLNRERLKVMRAFLLYGARSFGWLIPIFGKEAGGILNLFDEFNRHSTRCSDVSYYQSDDFKKDFLRFLSDKFIPSAQNPAVLEAVIAYFEIFDEVAVESPSDDIVMDDTGDGTIPRAEITAFSMESVPVLRDNVKLLDCAVDFIEVRNRVTNGEPLNDLALTPNTLASRKQMGQWPEVLQLSEKSLAILKVCDGRNSVSSIVEKVQDHDGLFADLPARQSVRIGLELLRHDGLLEENHE